MAAGDAGTQNGTARIEDGMRVRVDGGTGIVTTLREKKRRGAGAGGTP